MTFLPAVPVIAKGFVPSPPCMDMCTLTHVHGQDTGVVHRIIFYLTVPFTDMAKISISNFLKPMQSQNILFQLIHYVY